MAVAPCLNSRPGGGLKGTTEAARESVRQGLGWQSERVPRVSPWIKTGNRQRYTDGIADYLAWQIYSAGQAENNRVSAHDQWQYGSGRTGMAYRWRRRTTRQHSHKAELSISIRKEKFDYCIIL